jgi:hypothetical protein
MVDACRSLEKMTNLPRSFQILIPRLLPALYEIRNNRGVGHVGGDVDPNHMDATAVVAIASWILAELVRVHHGLSITDAGSLVDALVERRVPLVWQVGDMKRVLDPKLGLRDQVLLLIASATGPVRFSDLLAWTDYDDERYFKRLLRKMHRERLIEFSEGDQLVQILPPGALAAQELIEAATSR